MPDHIEERDFTVRLELRCAFAESYDGDDDGYAWAENLDGLRNELVAAVVDVLRRHPEWKLRAGNRGRPRDEEALFVAERRFE